MADDVQREIGRHDEAINTLKSEVHAMREDVAEIKSMISASKGGLRMLVTLGTIVATVAGLIGSWIARLFPGGGDG